MKILRIIALFLKSITAVIFIIFAVVIAFTVSYYLGSPILTSGSVIGGDTGYHLAWMHVLDRFWPRIPLWFPYAGGGSSIVFGYWVIPYYIVLYISHFFPFTIEQAVRIVQFLVVPVVAFELYLFGWLRLKNHIIGIIAAFLYPLSSIAWGWVAHAGFFSMHLSTMTLIPVLIFYDAYLESILRKKEDLVKRRLYLLGSSIFIAVALLVHLAAGASLLIGLPFYTLVRSVLEPTDGRLKSVLRGFLALSIVVISGVLLSAFLLYPQKRYFSLQAQDFTPYYSPEEYPVLPWRGLLGFERLKNVGSLHTPLFLSTIVSILGISGTILGFVFRKKTAALGALALFYVWLISSGKFLTANFPMLNTFLFPTNVRSVVVPGVLFPILAAYGIWSIADIPGKLIRLLTRKFKKINSFLLKPITYLTATAIAIILTGWLVREYRALQEYPTITDDTENVIEKYHGYGMMGVDLPLCIVPGWEKAGVPETKTCKDLIPPDFRKIVINPGGKDVLPEYKFDEEVKDLGLDEGIRVSISPMLGAFMQSYNGHSSSYMINSPSGQSLLTPSYIGILTSIFFGKDESTPEEISEISKWYGIKYIFLNKEGDSDEVFSKFSNSDWSVSANLNKVEMKEFKKSPGMSVISDKPVVLVIGSQKNRAYELIFRVSLKGIISYDKALLTPGKEKVDDYSLAELKKYSLLILNGYSYSNRGKAWSLLRDYVNNGGNLFIDTGWQYVAKDWWTNKIESGENVTYVANLKDPFPINKTVWGQAGNSFEGFELDKGLGKDIKVSDLKDLVWGDKAWGLAYAGKNDLRSWAKPLLYNNDKVILAYGEFGKGRVVWSGMNIFAHAYDKKSSGEYKFLENIFSYLLGDISAEQKQVSINRPFPDKVEISTGNLSTGYWLYWAESYTPDWKAYLLEGNKRTPLKIYKAGPGFQTIQLPVISKGEKVILEYNLIPIFLISFGITFLTLFLLLISIFDILIFHKKIEKTITGKVILCLANIKKSGKNKLNKLTESDEEY